MMEPDVQYLHQFTQVKKDTVDLDDEPDDCMSNEPTLGYTV